MPEQLAFLKCFACGKPSTPLTPLIYHEKLHCDNHACSRECQECKDWEEAIEKGGGTCGDTGQSLSVASRVSANGAEDPPQMPGNISGGSPGPPSSSYAEMMKKLKGGR